MNGLAAERLKKRRGGRSVLRGASLQVERGASLSLIGANGSGKTTLLELLAGLSRPSGGSIIWNGVDARKRPMTYRRCVGYAAHEPLIYPEWSGRQNLLFFARLRGIDNSRRQVEQELSEAGLTPFAETPARFYSRGMTQRLALARVFLRRSELLLLDEPFAGLDEESRLRLLNRLHRERERGAALILATHDAELSRQACEREARLRDGAVVFSRGSRE